MLEPPSPLDWARFARECWEQKPQHFGTQVPPLVAEDELWRALLDAASAWRRGGEAVIALFAGRGHLMSGVAPLLPAASDGGLEAYVARLRRALGGDASVLFELANLQCFSRAIWRRARQFMAGLLGEVGLPGQKADLDCFAGDYRTTPFGLHKDRASNFSIVVAGRKRILLWPSEYFQGRPVTPHSNGPFEALDDIDVERFESDAIVLEGGPGDLFYWPSSYWHVARSEGFATTVSLALYVRGPLGPMLDRGLEDLLPHGRGEVEAFRAEPQVSGALDGDRVRPLLTERAGVLAQRSGAWVKAMERRRLEYLSADGFLKVPPLGALSAELGGDLVLAAGSRLVFAVDAGRLIVAADGHSRGAEARTESVALLSDLARGGTVSIAALADPERSLAQWLHAAGSLEASR